jgi:LmbE family N-acetylglucosaminyl deacetylase
LPHQGLIYATVYLSYRLLDAQLIPLRPAAKALATDFAMPFTLLRFVRSLRLQFLIAFLGMLSLSFASKAQTENPYSTGAILQALKKLHSTGSVLYIAAHPDDENTRLLAWLANERNLRTGYLSITRGDGGQNLIGKEQGELLGLIRTQELLAARRIDGAEQFFTRANDFGFSKNPGETLHFWNEDSVLRDVVWAIRKFRPDVIVCRFPTTGEGGHGHHTASAILAEQAFEYAADPSRFPEQLTYVKPWRTRRLFWNTFNFGGNNTTSPDQLQVDAGVFNPLLGKSYGEIAAESRTSHKSQGFGTARGRGEAIEYFKQLKGDSVKKDLFEGIDQTWNRVAGGAELDKMTDSLLKKFNPYAPEALVPALISLYRRLNALDSRDPEAGYWKEQKLKETEKLLLICAGIWMDATTNTYVAVPGQPFELNCQIISRHADGFKLANISYPEQDSATDLKLGADKLYTMNHRGILPESTSYTNPYWLRNPHRIGMYYVPDQRMIGKPENDTFPAVVFHLVIQGLALDVAKKIQQKTVDPVKGEIYRPLEVTPSLTLGLSDRVVLIPSVNQRITVTLEAHHSDLSGELKVIAPQGWNVKIDQPSFSIKDSGATLSRVVSFTPLAGAASGTAQIIAEVNGQVYDEQIDHIEYDHIPAQVRLRPAEVLLSMVQVAKAGKRIGYIPGAGDEIPASLSRIGYTVTTLTDQQIASTDLSGYDAIVTGVRAFNVNPKLQQYHTQLMNYVKNGGNLIVQYNTNSRLGPMTAQPGPYPITLTQQRVTDENSNVQFVYKDNPSLNTPNKITPKDFEGWVQERGIYFATDIDEHYVTPLSMNDPNENPNFGSLLIAKYGKGNFVYTGIAFFRQLPAGNPGAYRLFVNLLSLPKNAVTPTAAPKKR